MKYVAVSRLKAIKSLAILQIDLKRFNRNKLACQASLKELNIKNCIWHGFLYCKQILVTIYLTLIKNKNIISKCNFFANR